MFDTYDFSRINANNELKMQQVIEFLEDANLSVDDDVEYFLIARSGQEIIGCGGLAGNVLKSINISPKLRGHGFSLKLLTELVNFAYEMGQFNLFLFTKPENEETFSQAGFFPIASVNDKVTLMENSSNRINEYCNELAAQRKEGEKIGSIVMNANPFTLGHQYLVREAAKSCDWLHLFIVRADRSYFSFHERLAMIKEGISEIENVTIHHGSDYMISRATFPSYFIKERGMIDYCHTAIDLQLFRNHIAPALGITDRFVGTEPFCTVTNFYNEQMEFWLNTKDISSTPINYCEIKRISVDKVPISASRVRALLAQGNLPEVQRLVPESTYDHICKFHNKKDTMSKLITNSYVAA